MSLEGTSVLVTGGTGAFAMAFARRLLALGVRRLALFSRSESKQAEAKAQLRDARIRWLIGDVRDAERLRDALRDVEVCVHAAALKRIEVCQEEPNEAKRTNVDGTVNVATACRLAGVKRAVMLSTDKAAAPATAYGASKQFAEQLWLNSNVYGAGTGTRYACTRYGNVLGSTGSVLPLWRSQVPTGRLTLTDPLMSRFWMRLDDACDLVLLALRDMRGGEIFIPRIGAATLEALARAVGPRCVFDIIGKRGNEKMHEVLISEDEAPYTYDMGTHYIIEPGARSWGTVPPLPAERKVPLGFVYRSDTAPRLDAAQLQTMLEAA